MLVHTAVPEKWNEDILNYDLEFTVTGESAEKKRKSQFSLRESFDNQINTQPAIILNNKKIKLDDSMNEETFDNQITTQQPAIILNNQKIKLDDSLNSNEETIEMIESDGGTTGTNHDIVYEEVVIPPAKRSYKCVVVKQKKPKSPVKTIMNYTQPKVRDEPKDEETFFLTEEGNISSTKVEQKEMEEEEEVQQPPSYKKSSLSSVESYSEFIFNGEIYVQMPKRVFEAEKEKIRAESGKYKAMLLNLRKQIDDLLEN